MDVSWLELRDHEVPFGDWWLSQSERARLDCLHIPKRHADWRLGRWTAKHAVSIYLNRPRNQQALAAIELRPAPSGRPEVFLNGRAAPLQLSLSHSHGIGLCTIGRIGAELGCDLEQVEPRSSIFIADYFTDEEQQLVARTPVAERDQILTLLWSIKESALKALGCGLRADTRSINAAPGEFQQTPHGQWCPLRAAHTSGRDFRGWWRVSCGLVRTIIADSGELRLIPLQLGVEG